jgi:hypothetical protein
MNRRDFLIGASVFGGTLVIAQHAQAQEATPDAHDLVYDGQLAKASREFESDGLGSGAILIDTVVAVFDTKKNAEKGFKTSAKIVDTLVAQGNAEGKNMTITKRNELSSPKLGKRRHAESIDLDIDGLAVTMVILRVQKDELLHVWSAIGLGSPAEDLFNLSDKMKFEDVDPEKDDELLALLPVLDDVPVGMSLSDEKVTREND